MSTALALNIHAPWTVPMVETAPKQAPAVLDEADWAVVAVALSRIRSRVGRPFRDERLTVEAVIWRARHKARWRDIPEVFGPWWRAAQLYYRWAKSGLWTRLQAALCEEGRADLAELFESESDETLPNANGPDGLNRA